MINLKETFEKYDEEFLKFGRIEQFGTPLSVRPDIYAFMLLDLIVPPKHNRLGKYSNMVAVAEHDEIWLDVNLEELAKNASEAEIRDLIRCGVRYDKSVESLAMYVYGRVRPMV